MNLVNRNLIGQNIVVFDLEIKELIAPPITWNDHDKMGISVGVAYTFRTSEFMVFMDDNLHELVDLLNQADLVTGFNIEGFDIPLLNATPNKTGVKFTSPRVYDLLFYSRLSTGWRPDLRFPSGLRLDDHLRGTFGEDFMKTADGAEAPAMWKRGDLGRLVSYCVADVRREAELFKHVWHGHPVRTQAHGYRQLSNPRLTMEAFKVSQPATPNPADSLGA